MPSVAEELAALRQSGITKNHAGKLKTAGGLKTPEQEEAALKAKAAKEKVYDKEAKQSLKETGVTELNKEQSFMASQRAAKMTDAEKKKEAAKNLQQFKGNAPSSFPVSPKAAKQSSSAKSPAKISDAVSPAAIIPPVSAAVQAEAEVKVEAEVAVKADEVPEVAAEPSSPPVVEDVFDDDVPELEELSSASTVAASSAGTQYAPTPTPAQVEPPKQNRAEKKARKFLQRCGMTPVKGITRVSMKISGNNAGIFVIDQPDVFQSSKAKGAASTYVVFGEARPINNNAMARQQYQRQAMAAAQTNFASETANSKPAVNAAAANNTTTISKDSAADASSSSGGSSDIDMVMSHGNCSRSQAEKVLADNDGDVVNAIMSLTG